VSERWWQQATPLGDVTVVASAPGVVTSLGFGTEVRDRFMGVAPRRDARVAREIDEFFEGVRRAFGVRVDLGEVAAPFRRAVLETVAREVPYGETATYGEIAQLVGHPGAARAVGSAMARNPVQLLIPCHRVVAAHGLGGYGGGTAGLALKQALLDLERRGGRAGRASRRSG
jgi:methylated-DNA-[protein]-cysteine S-methyltransferase